MTSTSTQRQGGRRGALLSRNAAVPKAIPDAPGEAALDSAHIGDIVGAFGRIRRDGTGAFSGRWRRLRTLMVITGPGLIVMVGDNDAGGVATYTQAGQNYGMNLLWTLMLLIPVLYVNQEMVLRLGAVTRVWARAVDIRAFRQVLGRLQRGRPADSQRLDHRHRIHRCRYGSQLLGLPQDHCD